MEDILFEFEKKCEVKFSGSTPKNYTSHVSKFLYFIGKSDVDSQDVFKYNIHIRKLSFSYRNVALNAIKAYFLLILNMEVEGVANIRPPKQSKKPIVYDCDEMALKIDHIKNLKHKAILAITLCCWLRKSELINLKVSDINGSLRIIHIKQSKGCKDRIIPISAKTLEILRNYYKKYRPKEYLFEGVNGGKYGKTSVDKITKKHLFPTMRYHSIRASGATYALTNGTDLKTVSEILGHSKIQTTQHYIPILYKNIKQAI